jgi:DNA processing protein
VSTRALRCWLTLHRVAGLGVHSLHTLLGHYGSVEGIFDASRSDLKSVLRGASNAVEQILAGPDSQALEHDLAWLAQPDHHLITLQDAAYPRLLREIAQPPIVLYVVGAPAHLTNAQLAIVGSRNPTAAGVENAAAFARALVQAGLTITSGLALGIDGAAHRGALDAGGCSVAVLGSGIDQIYPAQHARLADEISTHGALLSEFALGTPPKGENFPRRNRLISGLSVGTLVVEAALQSGSLITARYAAEQGREVFALPGSIHSPLARGCHALIRDGAKLVETAQDIVEELRGLLPLVRQQRDESAFKLSPVDDAPMSGLLRHIGHDPVSIDTLVERTGLTPHSISSMLLEMELLGMIEACAGGRYIRI